VAFLSNPEDERKILKAAFRKAVAQKIYLGITDWLKEMKP
jgi:N-acetylmuramoyl-L-alanine amidase